MCPCPTRISFVLASALLAACAASPRPVTPAPRVAVEHVEDLCPMNVAGTAVAPEAIEGGAALVFTTSGDVAELRRRVRTIARLNALRMGVPYDATALAATDDVAGGARLNIRPLDEGRRVLVLDHAVQRAATLARGACPAVSADAMIAWITDGGDLRGSVVTSR